MYDLIKLIVFSILWLAQDFEEKWANDKCN